MCLIAWQWAPDSASPLLIAGNRDEYYARPTASLQWWGDKRILAGRDSNYRDPALIRQDVPSRGTVVQGFVEGDMTSGHYLQSLLSRSSPFNPFHLLVFDGNTLMGLESRHQKIIDFEPGFGAVSNADFNTPWPKVTQLNDSLHSSQGIDEIRQDEVIWRSLSDRNTANDSALPRTGISLDQKRVLSSAFIATPAYGTRASTLIRLKDQGGAIEERRFNPAGHQGSTRVCF
jgi:uncharacterized protein with NRDE domain